MLRAILVNVLKAATKYPVLSLLFLFVLVSAVPMVTPALENARTSLTTPLNATTGFDPFHIPDGQAELAAMHERTRQALAAARLDNARLRRELAQAQRLDTGRREGEPELMRVSADVLLGHDASLWRHSLIINRGSEHGLSIGDPVVHGRVLVGRIGALGPWTSRVQLMTDPAYRGVKIIVLPSGENYSTAPDESLDAYPRGMARGSADRDMEVALEHIELDAQVRPGDLVFTSAQSVTVPGGLIVGRIRTISRSERAQFATVRVSPWGDPGRLEQVQVIRWPRSLDLSGLELD